MTRRRDRKLLARLALAAALGLLGAGPSCRGGLTLLPSAELIATVMAGEVVGLVTDAHSGAPLADAVVRLTPTALEVSTDAAGRFRLGPAPEGRYRLRVLRIGYVQRADSLVLGPGSGAVVAVRLTRTTLRLEYGAADAGNGY